MKSAAFSRLRASSTVTHLTACISALECRSTPGSSTDIQGLKPSSMSFRPRARRKDAKNSRGKANCYSGPSEIASSFFSTLRGSASRLGVFAVNPVGRMLPALSQKATKVTKKPIRSHFEPAQSSFCSLPSVEFCLRAPEANHGIGFRCLRLFRRTAEAQRRQEQPDKVYCYSGSRG